MAKYSNKCCFIFTWRQATILNGILQSTFHFFLTILMVLTLKISLLMREKQLADLQDHGADITHLESRDDLPETNDLMKLWDAKVQNDVKIDISTFCIVLNTFYALSCVISVYGAIIKNKVTIAVSVFCCIMSLFVLTTIIFVSYCFYTNMYLFQLKEEGLKIIEKNGKLVGIVIAYSIFATAGHHAPLVYCMELHGKPLLSRRSSSNVTEIIETEQCINGKPTWNPLKYIVDSIKYLHFKYESTKPTPV